MIAQLDKDMLRMRPFLVPRRLVSYALFEGRPVTTRGQWINPLLKNFLQIGQQWPNPKPVNSPIYIIGTGRSGTTILGKLFHMHPACGFLNEPKLLWHTIYPYEDIIGTYSQEPAQYALDATRVSDDIRSAAHQIYGFYLWLTRASRIVDKYPEILYRTSFIQAIFPDARFVFLVRNGADTLQSIATWSQSHAQRGKQNVHDWWGVNDRKWKLLLTQVVPSDPLLSQHVNEIANLTRQVDRAAVEWIAAVQKGLFLLDTQPQQSFYLVRYEDLVHSPVDTVKRLLDFCWLPQDDVVLEYARRVLVASPPKRSVDLHPVIRPAFQVTMESLGYQV